MSVCGCPYPHAAEFSVLHRITEPTDQTLFVEFFMWGAQSKPAQHRAQILLPNPLPWLYFCLQCGKQNFPCDTAPAPH